jgi:Transposase DDE domain
MRFITPADDLAQNALFDSAALDSCSWWVTDLNDSARRRLEENWQGLFRRSLLKLMPATQLGARFSPDFGRPTKELHAMAALVFIMEFKNWTVEEAVDAYTYDNSIHFALNLGNRHNYLCTRTLEDYRARVREDQSAGEIFLEVTSTLVDALHISIKTQRLDSTHLLSDMANFGRTKLLGIGVKRLLCAIKRHAPQCFDTLSAELRERYEPTVGRLFGEASASKEGRGAAQLQVAHDMHQLIETFADEARINTRTTYQALVRLFAEHCEIKAGKISVRPKAQDQNGQSAHTLQNPSDPEAGYDGHKGAGYQVQLSETSAVENPVQLIVGCLPQSAGEQDAHALAPVLEQLQSNQMLPEELAADTAYGSDENHQHAASNGITLISPVPGQAPKQGGSASEEAQRETQGPPKPRGRRQSTEQSRAVNERAKRNAARREEQQSEAWRARYRRRAGIEGVNRGLDRRTGIKELRVRGMKAVAHAVYSKVMGWNIVQSARALRKQAIAARKAQRAAIGMLIEWMKMQIAMLVAHMLWRTRVAEPVTSRRHGRQPSRPRWNPTPA